MADYIDPKDLLDAYNNGLEGAICDPEDVSKLLGELPMPLFGAAAYQLEFSGEGKLSLPFKSLLKFDPKFGPHEAQETGDCLDPNTIIVSNFCKKVSDINIGDKIYQSDGSFTTVISKQSKWSYEPMLTIRTKGSIPISVTTNHRVLVGRKEEIVEGNVKTKVITKKWIKAAEIKKGDYLITPLNLQVDDLPINPFTTHEDFNWFLGYFLGDGWCDKQQIEITFAGHQTNFFNQCKDFLEQFGFNVKKCDYKGKQTTAFRLRCWCPKLADFLRNISYDNQKNKLFPSWAIGNPDIVRGLVDSDGFYKENKEVFDSTSLSLAYGVYYSYLKMGYKPTINKFHRAKKGAYKDSQSYRVQCIYQKKKNYSFIQDDYLFILVNNIDIEEGPHEVYDIGINSKEHAFLANGIIVHNCVSHATRTSIDGTRAVEIDIKGESEAFIARSATEAIYQSRGHRGQGMSCSGAARYVHQVGGILLRKKYKGVDLSIYDGSVGARHRIPRSILIDEASKHQVKTVSLITTVSEARDALANGYFISVCSNYGFSSRRDKHGIANPRGRWNHAMGWIAGDDTQEIYNETLFLVQNSWGAWNSGPKRHGQPDGSFWIREGVAAGMLAQRGAWVFSNVEGFPAKQLPNYGLGGWV